MLWLGLIFVIIVLLLCLSVQMGICYKRVQQQDHLTLHIGVFNGLLLFQKEIPSLRLQSEGVVYREQKERLFSLHDFKESKEQWNVTVKRMVGLWRILTRFLRKINVRKLYWHSRIGTGDAAHTGVLLGVVYGLKGGVVWLFAHFLHLATQPTIVIEPAFTETHFYTEFECIVRFRIGHAILAGIFILFHLRKGRRA